MVTESAVILKRFYFLEREIILLQAGWLPAVAGWEAKLLLPEVTWESSVLARDLRQRILELRYPERRIAIDDDQALLEPFRRCGNAPNWLAFVSGLAQVVKPCILNLYQRYLAVADRLDDGPTEFILRHGVPDLNGQIERLRAVADAGAAAFPAQADEARAWRDALSAVFSGISAEHFFLPQPFAPDMSALDRIEKPFSISRAGVRDPRFQRPAFAWPDRHTPGNPGEGAQLRARQAVHHVNEVWAAEMAGACLFDFGRNAPHEFIEEAARWCYDEIRHCRMGYERLKHWGFSDAEIPLDSFSYDAGAEVDALTRLGIIFYFEATYIHTKKERTVTFGQLGDRLSSHDMDFDWADELIHTYYGKRWVEAFLRQSGTTRTLSTVKEDARQAVSRQIARATPEDKAATDIIFRSITSKMAAP
jgi:uncharacterized ferritin-like protein (DUF455 family)